ncbi:hypothetical protein C823_004817 [Eubacterium plexicaudatum ASF492]|nr:hypothetical protein C823_004817 [Eubacterium plexicaudatum ASF492]
MQQNHRKLASFWDTPAAVTLTGKATSAVGAAAYRMPPAPTGAKAPEPVFLFREGQPPLCRCKVRYGKQAA